MVVRRLLVWTELCAAVGAYPVLGWCYDNGRLRVMDIDEVGAVGSGWRVLEEIEQ